MHTLFTTKECNRVLYLSPLSLPVVVVFTTVRNTFRHLLRVSRGQSLFRRRKAIEVSLDDVFFYCHCPCPRVRLSLDTTFPRVSVYSFIFTIFSRTACLSFFAASVEMFCFSCGFAMHSFGVHWLDLSGHIALKNAFKLKFLTSFLFFLRLIGHET